MNQDVGVVLSPTAQLESLNDSPTEIVRFLDDQSIASLPLGVGLLGDESISSLPLGCWIVGGLKYCITSVGCWVVGLLDYWETSVLHHLR